MLERTEDIFAEVEIKSEEIDEDDNNVIGNLGMDGKAFL